MQVGKAQTPLGKKLKEEEEEGEKRREIVKFSK